jgi:glutaminase
MPPSVPGIEIITHDRLGEIRERARAGLARRDPQEVLCMDAPGRCHGEAVCSVAGGTVRVAGDGEGRFTLMSAVKPFLLLRVLECYGAGKVAAWVDDEPSGMPYWSLEQLRADGGKPRNAMLNSGAMLLASRLPGNGPLEQEKLFVAWLAGLAPEAGLRLDGECFAEVMQDGRDSANWALAEELAGSRRVDSAEAAYEIYFRICCLAGTIRDVAWLGHALAMTGPAYRARVLRAMTRCGLYEASPAWFAKTGLPAKSGVSGVMFGVWPGQGCVAASSPWLDRGGNPILPQAVLAQLAADFPAGEF